MPDWEYIESFTFLVLLVLGIGYAYIVVRNWWNHWKKKRQISAIIQKGFAKQKGETKCR